MNKCIKCGSYAFNLYKEGIDQGGLCDVHYWQGRAHRAEALMSFQDGAQPEQEPVAWTPLIERHYKDGVLVSQTIQYNPQGEKHPYPHEPTPPIGEIVLYTGDGLPCAPFKQVKWYDGMMPLEGTKLYTLPQPKATQEPVCPHIDEPKGCYRVRCQLGDKCVDAQPKAESFEHNVCGRCGGIVYDPVLPQTKREWVGLTDAEREQLWSEWENGHVVEAVEAKLKEKNT